MILKTLISVLIEYFTKDFNFTKLTNNSKINLSRAVQQQTKLILVNILSALILGFIIIYSLVAIIERLNAMLMTLENGSWYSILFFIFLALISSFTAYLILKTEAKPEKIEVPPPFELQNILTSFLVGFAEGFDEPQKKPEENKI